MKKLALLGGQPLIQGELPEKIKEMMKWPIITEEDEAAALQVIRTNDYSHNRITEQFEAEFCQWLGVNHAVSYCNGTMALAAAMFAIGLEAGDEIICPTKTYWASAAPAASFGAKTVFCNVNEMLSMDPDDIEWRITPKTKALMVVHYLSYPCDMDRIMSIAEKHHLKVIEDVSHAQGGLYKGRRLGTFGDVAAMSLMSGKSFAAGELGILVTNHRRIYERAVAYGHYNRNNEKYITESEDLFPYYHLPLGGVKGRANQLCCALARVQLKYYDERCAEIRKAMNFFWDLLEDLPGITPIRADEREGSNNAGFYCATGLYRPEELEGLPVQAFVDAVNAELGGGIRWINHGANKCLHTHPVFRGFDLLQNATLAQEFLPIDATLKPSEEFQCFSVPWLKKYDEEWIRKIAGAFRTVVENRSQLLFESDKAEEGGRWYGTGV